MPEAAVSHAPGWFGKMPSRGDFASRRLPSVFVDGWDAWLQRELVRSRQSFGADWLPAFLVAPVRRFWLAAGVLGPLPWVGVWMPSVDSVGRHFPFTIAAAQPNAVDGRRAALAHAAWFDAIEAVARQVLDPQVAIDDLERVLADVAAFGAAVANEPPAGHLSITQGSLWWCEGARENAQFQHADALPAAFEFDTLLRPCA